jgi:hypothetical protein
VDDKRIETREVEALLDDTRTEEIARPDMGQMKEEVVEEGSVEDGVTTGV